MHAAASWLTAIDCPPTRRVPLREATAVLGSTVTVTVALPLPLAGDTRAQPSDDWVVHAQPAGAVIASVAVVPEAGALTATGDTA